MPYLLDSNIFITCKNEMPRDIFQGLWQNLAVLAHNGHIFSCVKVREEIERGNDDLALWCKDNLPEDFFMPFDAHTEYGRLMNWANQNPIFKTAARQQFAIVADAYLVAMAAAHNMTVVTFETSDPKCKKRVKIPDACKAVGVKCCSLNDLLHHFSVVF